MVKKTNKNGSFSIVWNNRRIRYSLLMVGLIFVVAFFGGVGFTTFSLGEYEIGIGTDLDAIGIIEGAVLEEEILKAGNNYIVLKMTSEIAIVTETQKEAGYVSSKLAGTIATLVCSDNGASIELGELKTEYVYHETRLDRNDNEIVLYKSKPFYTFSVDNVYFGEQNYEIRLTGYVLGVTFRFVIVGDENSMSIEDDTNNQGGEPPTTSTVPVFTKKPANVTYVEISPSDAEFEWLVIDDNLESVRVYQNGSIIGSFVITGYTSYPILVSVGDLLVGVHVFNCTVFDTEGNKVTHIATVTVTGEEETDWMQWVEDNPLIVVVLVIVAAPALGIGVYSNSRRD